VAVRPNSWYQARFSCRLTGNPVKRGRIAALRASIVESGDSDPASRFTLARSTPMQPGVHFLNDATDELFQPVQRRFAAKSWSSFQS